MRKAVIKIRATAGLGGRGGADSHLNKPKKEQRPLEDTLFIQAASTEEECFSFFFFCSTTGFSPLTDVTALSETNPPASRAAAVGSREQVPTLRTEGATF